MEQLVKDTKGNGKYDKYYIDCSHYATNPKSIEVLELIKNMERPDVAILHAIATDDTIKKKNRHIVVKISNARDNHSNSIIEKEYEISNALYKSHLPGFIKHLCIFQCYDDTTRFFKKTREHAAPTPITHQICNADTKNATTNKRVLVMPYIRGGSLEDYNWTADNLDLLKSLAIHTILSLATAFDKLGFIHNDLHWGNVLFKSTTVSETAYILGTREITIQTGGYKVVITDFEKSVIGTTDTKLFWRNLRKFLYSGVSFDNKDGETITWNHKDIILQIESYIEQSTPPNDVIKLLPKIQKSVFDIWKPESAPVYTPLKN
jgi:hypothetical protein